MIEVDETYVGGEKPGKRGRGASGKSLVVIAVEINANRIVHISVKSATGFALIRPPPAG